MALLSMLGLMKVKEHERIVETKDDEAYTAWHKAITDRDDMRIERDGADSRAADWKAKYEAAVTMNKRLTESMAFIEGDRDHWRNQAMRDEADAEAMRRKRRMDRERAEAKRRKD